MPKLVSNSVKQADTVEEYLASLPRTKTRSGPLWAGPCGEGPNGGITFSLLSRFLSCRERFRVMVVEGLRPAEGFNHRLEFGTMWHICEEHHASSTDWGAALKAHVKLLLSRYPLQQDQVLHYYGICKTTFAAYISFWAGQKTPPRVTVAPETNFDVSYKLPSGRVVRLRGKRDNVFAEGKGEAARLWIQENKTRSQVDDAKVVRQLSMDLQTMIYVISLLEERPPLSTVPFGGVLYNVVRRSMHKQTKGDGTLDGFCTRLAGLIADDVTANQTNNGWFARWKVEIRPADVERFKARCLNPILEQLCDWWKFVTSGDDPWRDDFDGDLSYRQAPPHWQHPFGCTNWIDETGASDMDGYLLDGNMAGLTATSDLFPELTPTN